MGEKMLGAAGLIAGLLITAISIDLLTGGAITRTAIGTVEESESESE